MGPIIGKPLDGRPALSLPVLIFTAVCLAISVFSFGKALFPELRRLSSRSSSPTLVDARDDEIDETEAECSDRFGSWERGEVYEDPDGRSSGEEDAFLEGWLMFVRISVFFLEVFTLSVVYYARTRRLWRRLIEVDVGSAEGWMYILWNLSAPIIFWWCFGPRRMMHDSGNWIAVAELGLTAALGVDRLSNGEWGTTWDEVGEWSWWVLMCSGIGMGLLCAAVPRRPKLWRDGTEVDDQFSCSAVARISFSWIKPLLNRARNERTLEYSDLPALDRASTAQALEVASHGWPGRFDERSPLWRWIVRAHWKSFVNQWTFSILESFAMVLPLICLFKILRILEHPDPRNGAYLGHLIFCLGLAKIMHVYLDTWLGWIALGRSGLNVRTQLSAVIYAKALRMKIVDGGIHSGSDAVPIEDQVTTGGPVDNVLPPNETDPLLPIKDDTTSDSGEKVPDDKDDAKKDDESSKVAREVVNLLGMDLHRIYIFAGWNSDIVRGVVKLLITLVFLVLLLGWWSTIAALAVPLLLHPLSQLASTRYTAAMMDLSNARDDVSHTITEALHGIRQIKITAAEPQWEAKLLAKRSKVLEAQWRLYTWGTYIIFAFFGIPVMMGAAAFTVYVLLYREMTPSVAFTALSVLTGLEWTVASLPVSITELLDAKVSAKRLEEYLNSDERRLQLVHGDRIRFADATITWPTANKQKCFELSGLNMEFEPNELSVICGKTGSGKSLLLSAIIGEAEIVSGAVQVPTSSPMYQFKNNHIPPETWLIPNAKAYVSQIPWIENASVKDSILYGLPYSEQRYKQVLHSCTLEVDIASFPDGDATEIGATGINLSGGQKWRLTLARALYSRASILVLDDIFSAVDAHVGRHLLEHALRGELAANRTRILVTHHVGLVGPHAHKIFDLDKRTEEVGSAESSGVVSESSKSSSTGHDVPAANADVDEQEASGGPPAPTPQKFHPEELRAQGRISPKVYKSYISASGSIFPWILALALFVTAATATLARSYWLAIWTEAYTSSPPSSGSSGPSGPSPNLKFYLSIYLSLALISILSGGIKTLAILSGSYRASRKLFERVTSRVLRAKTRWLDTQPVGRILNRFVADFVPIDGPLGMDMVWALDGSFSTLTVVVSSVLVSGWMLLPMGLLLGSCVWIVAGYLDGARDLRRLQSTAQSPVFDLVTASLSGLATIRCFGREGEYLNRMFGLVDRMAGATFNNVLAGSWVRFRQGSLGVLLTVTVAVLVCVVLREEVSGALAGFALSFAMNFSSVVEATILRYTMLELEMNCTERVLEYAEELPNEDPEAGEVAPESWPDKGEVVFSDLTVAYSEELSPVLKGVSFAANPGERIGIVGRTGSGKTTLTLALLRMLASPKKGKIEIDGLDIQSLRTADLRSRLTVIPQDPVLFSGTLRSNLDPFDRYDDVSLFEVLRRVRLLSSSSLSSSSSSSSLGEARKDMAAGGFSSLSHKVSRGGSNLSQGQKQLLCLARAMLERSRILILDEATSAVDAPTDAVIQRSIREDFGATTMLVVAHRLSTVVDFDKVLVMGGGEVLEFGSPRELMAKENGSFRGLVEESGEREELVRRIGL